MRLTGDHTSAAELVQETYLNAWKSLSTLRDKSRMRAWVFSILRNQWKKQLTRKSSRPREESGTDVEQLHSKIEKPTVDDSVQLALSKLDEKFRLPILLVTMEGMKVDEAADVLELPRGTVLSRISRGKQKLKELLTKHITATP